MRKKKPSRIKGVQKQTNESDPRFEYLSNWVPLDLHFELRIGMAEARVTQARLVDPNVKAKCNYCGLALTESEYLELEVEYQGAESELYNTLLLCKDIEPCQKRGFFTDEHRLSRYLSPQLIQHYKDQTLNKFIFSPLNALRKQSTASSPEQT